MHQIGRVVIGAHLGLRRRHTQLRKRFKVRREHPKEQLMAPFPPGSLAPQPQLLCKVQPGRLLVAAVLHCPFTRPMDTVRGTTSRVRNFARMPSALGGGVHNQKSGRFLPTVHQTGPCCT